MLALDEAKGSTGFTPIDPGLAGALLVDLGRLGALPPVGKELHPDKGAGIEHPVLAQAVMAIAGSSKPRTVKAWVGRLPHTLKPLTGTVARPLVDAGSSPSSGSRSSACSPGTRFPEADPARSGMLRSRLRDVLLGELAPQEQDALLLGLLEPLGLADRLREGTNEHFGDTSLRILKQIRSRCGPPGSLKDPPTPNDSIRPEISSTAEGRHGMAQRMVRFSDLTNNIIEEDGAVVRIVVEQHPALWNGPVEIEAAQDEVDPIRKGALSVVSLKLYQGDGSEPEAVTMEIEAFNNLAGGMDMADIIRRAEPAYPPRKQARPAPAPAIEKLDYSTFEHAGKPHRGKTTEAEKETVRSNLAAINDRLQGDGIRTIDLDNAEHVTRYGLEALAKEAGHFQQ